MAEYIEREALLKGIDEYHHTAHIQSITRETEEAKNLWRGIRFGVNYCRNHILEAPTADVAEVRHGELKGIHDFGWNRWLGYCSLCGIEHRGISKIDLIYGHKYCHNCGAKMDGKGENDV